MFAGISEDRKVRYSFGPKELNNWKGRITERLVQCYIEGILAPRLREEGFDLVFFDTIPAPLNLVEKALLR